MFNLKKINLKNIDVKNNNKEEYNIKNRKREITIIIVCIMVLILFFSGYSFGKEFSKANINANAEIAEPILIVDNNPNIDITAINNKGYYDFKIKNYDKSGKVNQVELNYNIEILSNTDESIAFKLYKDDQEITLENNKSKEFILKKGNLQEENYKLEIVYDKSKSDSVTDILQDVQIKVHSEQVKN